MKSKLNYEELLRHENEITKLKLQAEFGAVMDENSDLNPAIENIWLNQILDYERAAAENKQISIREKCGFPAFVDVEEIKEDDLALELQKVMEMLRSKNIIIDSIDGIDDREMYRFITEELIEQDIDVNLPKNMLTCFIYEEFYPNDDADIRRHSKEFLSSLTNKENNYFETFLFDNNEEEDSVKIGKLQRRLNLFRDAFDEIRLDEFNIKSVKINEEEGESIFDFCFTVLPPESKIFQCISGEGKFNFINKYDFWCIRDIVMKGVV